MLNHFLLTGKWKSGEKLHMEAQSSDELGKIIKELASISDVQTDINPQADEKERFDMESLRVKEVCNV
jgi:hypothetical protein